GARSCLLNLAISPDHPAEIASPMPWNATASGVMEPAAPATAAGIAAKNPASGATAAAAAPAATVNPENSFAPPAPPPMSVIADRAVATSLPTPARGAASPFIRADPNRAPLRLPSFSNRVVRVRVSPPERTVMFPADRLNDLANWRPAVAPAREYCWV